MSIMVALEMSISVHLDVASTSGLRDVCVYMKADKTLQTNVSVSVRFHIYRSASWSLQSTVILEENALVY